MVLMYHEIGYPEGEWRRTPENFRRDLQILFEQGYRAVTLTDLVRGEINIPAGTSPVVFTFDDGNRGNFNYLEADRGPVLDPDCAVAIMESFYEENPDFGLAATFFIYYPNPFRQAEYIEKKLNYLVQQGFEIGNHTYGHANLREHNSEVIQQELAGHVKTTGEYIPQHKVNSLALLMALIPGILRWPSGVLMVIQITGTRQFSWWGQIPALHHFTAILILQNFAHSRQRNEHRRGGLTTGWNTLRIIPINVILATGMNIILLPPTGRH